jgi:hypothetical protein
MQWSAPRRAAYILGAPLIPLMRWRPLWRRARQLPASTRPPGFALSLAALVVATSVGEAIGYAAGEGTAQEELSLFEYHRERLLMPAEREEFLS